MIKDTLKREPVMVGQVVALIVSMLTFLIAMGVVELTDLQFNAMVELVTVAVPLFFVVASIISRYFVTPMAAPRTNDGEDAVIVAKSKMANSIN